MHSVFAKKIIIFFVCFAFVFFGIAGISEVSGTDTGEFAGYKAASDLGSSDKYEEEQKNYIASEGASATNHIYASAEWTDKKAGKARITIKGEMTEAAPALYAFTTCTAHGFSREICRANIMTLLGKYSSVDIIGINGPSDGDIIIRRGVTESGLDSILDEFTWAGGRHWASSLYTGLTSYLTAGGGSGQTAGRPACIYVSMDNFAYPSLSADHYNTETWNILKQYRSAGRYYSVADSSVLKIINQQSLSDPGCILTANTVIGLFDPLKFPGIDAQKITGADQAESASSGWLVPNAADYLYTDSFADIQGMGIPGTDAALKCSINSDFTIDNVSTNLPDSEVTTDNGSILVKNSKYVPGTDELIVTAEISLKSSSSGFGGGDWGDVLMNGTDFIVGGAGNITASLSPKLYKEPEAAPVYPTPEPTETRSGKIALSGCKYVTGDVPEKDQIFIFEMTEDAGNDTSGYILPDSPAAETKGEGDFSFGDIVFKKPGEYKFSITERKGGNAHYVYDGRTVSAQVTVTADGSRLLCSVKYSGGAENGTCTFSNEFKSSKAGRGSYLVRVSQFWNDSANSAGVRPPQMDVKLLNKDGTETGRTAVISAASGWTAMFRNLPKPASEYLVEEETISHYSFEYSRLGSEFTVKSVYNRRQ